MIWMILSAIVGGMAGFVICSVMTIDAVMDRDEEIGRLNKELKLERLAKMLDKFGGDV